MNTTLSPVMNGTTAKAKRVLITPSLANQYLESNVKNRIINKNLVERYAKEMAEGRWYEDTYELIKFSESGRLLDGQHRLLALIKSKTSFYFHVVHGVKDAVFSVLDTGSKRTSGDTFHISEIKNGNQVSAIIQMYYRVGSSGLTGNDRYLSNQHLISKYNERPQFWQDVTNKSLVWYKAFGNVVTPSLVGGFYALFFDLDEEKSYSFMNQFMTGMNIENETISKLRQILIKDKTSPKKIGLTYKMAYIIKTWNAFREGVEIKQLKFNSKRSEFPTPI